MFPFLLAGRETEPFVWKRYCGFVLTLSSYIAVFYANYLCFVKRFLLTKQFTRFILSNLALIICLIPIVHFLLLLFFPNEIEEMSDFSDWGILRFIIVDMLGYIFIITNSVAYKMTGSWYAMVAERQELERSRSEAELKNLKSQLNPHFLFNTLNNIYSLIASSPERAQEVVHELSRLLRYVLYESSQPFVTMEKDLDFIRNYVELMRIRLPGHVSVEISIRTTSPDFLIAPLLFITPIENAFKHGVSNNKPSFVRIDIQADDKEINCHIHNSYFPKNENDKSGSGIGLVNLNKRLHLIYPDKYMFTYGRKNSEYHCTLKIWR